MSTSRLARIFSAAPTLLAAFALVLVAQSARAQSTIFNIPSTDTVSQGKGYFEIDFLPQLPGPDSGSSTMIYNPRIVIGLPHNGEFGINFPVFHNSDWNPTSLAYIQPNVKFKLWGDDDQGMALDAGTVVNFPMNNTDAQLSWGYIYGNFSKKTKAGARFTFGGYGVIAKQDDPVKVGFVGTRGGVLLGYEQPISGPISFVADWFSGKNTIGYFTPGVSIVLPHSGLLNVGYSIGNDAWQDETANYKDRYFFVYYGITFP